MPVISLYMNALCKKLLKEYENGAALMQAIVNGTPGIIRILSDSIINHSDAYRMIETREGERSAGDFLVESLIIFRRQVEHNKVVLTTKNDKIYTDKHGTELMIHLDRLLSMKYEIEVFNRTFNQSGEFEQNLINGRGYQKIMKLKGIVISALHGFGCKEEDEKEEIFNEALLLFWKKLVNKEIGFYIKSNYDKPDNYHVYNLTWYQNSKLSTFLSGIARNIFLGRIRKDRATTSFSEEYMGIEEPGDEDHGEESTLIFMFLYYRVFIEHRKIRTIISILQYDCNLEDREVRHLLGINNARIHSCRLRSNFHEWYEKNMQNTHRIFDHASRYLKEREEKLSAMNEKIRFIMNYEQNPRLYLFNQAVFREEFRSHHDFSKYHSIFKILFYLSSVGKPSALSGLPNESDLRLLLKIYKEYLFGLPGPGSLFYLLHYGCDEPGNAILDLLQSLSRELQEAGAKYELVSPDSFDAGSLVPKDRDEFSGKIFETNTLLFSHFSGDQEFITRIKSHESPERAI